MLIHYLLATLAAGLLAGLLVTPAMYLKTVPLILQAETYEDAAGGHHHGEAEVAPHDHAAPAAEARDEEGAELPFGRLGNTMLANLVAGAGFALLLGGLLCCLAVALRCRMVFSGGLRVSLPLPSCQPLAFRRSFRPCLPPISPNASSGGSQPWL